MTLVDSFDQGGSWDSGLQWDVNVGPNPGDVSKYLNLVTSKHNQKPKFMAMLAFLAQALADCSAVAQSLIALFDIDTAVGNQLDKIGQWVGITRNISVPLTGVFFSWAVEGLGWDQGSWTIGVNVDELVQLSDTAYRLLLRAKIAANNWDGTIPGAYAVWNIIFAGTGYGILIQDLEDMHMIFALTGPVPDAVTKSLFTGGYLNLKLAGVAIDKYYTPAVANAPYFGWGVNNSGIGGWSYGAWGVPSPGN